MKCVTFSELDLGPDKYPFGHFFDRSNRSLKPLVTMAKTGIWT
jgi:hypothetical protein